TAARDCNSRELMYRQSSEPASNSRARLPEMTRFALAPGRVLGVEYCGVQSHNSRPDPHERALPMSYLVDAYHRDTVATAPVSARVAFIRRTYAHLAAAILAFVGIEALIFSSVNEVEILNMFAQFGKAGWIGLMLLFVFGGYAAQRMARSQSAIGMQY